MAIGAGGVAAVVWVRELDDGVTRRIEAAVRSPGGDFGAVQTVRQVAEEPDISESLAHPRVAIDALGEVVVDLAAQQDGLR